MVRSWVVPNDVVLPDVDVAGVVVADVVEAGLWLVSLSLVSFVFWGRKLEGFEGSLRKPQPHACARVCVCLSLSLSLSLSFCLRVLVDQASTFCVLCETTTRSSMRCRWRRRSSSTTTSGRWIVKSAPVSCLTLWNANARS